MFVPVVKVDENLTGNLSNGLSFGAKRNENNGDVVPRF